MPREFSDITEERATLGEVTRVQSLQAHTFDTALSHLSDFVYIFDLEGRFVYANEPLLSLWGISLEEARGKNFFDLKYPEELADRLQRQIQEAATQGKRVVDETAYVSPTGQAGYYEYIFNPIVGPDGRVQGVAGSTRVITARKRAEEQTAFLSHLGQRLALIDDPEEIMRGVTTAVGVHLNADRCYLCEWDADLGRAVVPVDWSSTGAKSLVGTYDLHQYGTRAWWLSLTAGNVAIDDFETHFLARDFLENYRELGIRSYATARFRRDGSSVATLVVTMPTPRVWREDELALLENVVARAWPLVEKARSDLHATFLGRLSEKISLASDPDEITRVAIQTLGEHLKLQRCYFFEALDSPDRVKITENWHPPGMASLAGEYALFDFGKLEWWRQVRARPTVVHHVADDPSLDAERFASLGIHSFVTVPFSRDAKWVAGLAATSDRPRRWGANEVALLENVVARVWPAVERARVSSALHRSAERLSLAIAAADLGDFSWDAATDRMTLSPRAAEMYGLSPDTVIERERIRDLLHEDDRDLARRANEEAMASHTDYDIEYRVRLASGGWRWVAARGRGSYAPDGTPIGMQGVVQDITARKETEEKLRVQEAQLRAHAMELEQRVEQRTASLREAISQMEEFSYSVSHDLRGPLRAMNLYAQALLEDYGPHLDETARGYLDRIQRSSHRMEKLTHDILTYSRVAQSQVSLSPVDIGKLVADVLNQYVELQPPLAKVEVIGPLAPVSAHEASLGQVFSNLLANAAKFVAPGVKPHIRIWTERHADTVRIWIVDNGIGIQRDNQARIFQVFERLPTGSHYAGTGIGLAIVRKAMEKMSGRCGVESDGETGSRFWLELAAP